jgi:hypothetical protein
LKIKLYTEKQIIPEGVPYTFMLIPFWGIYSESPTDPDAGRFLELKEKGTELYELVEEPSKADYFLLPFGYSFDAQQQKVIRSFLDKAKAHNKKTLIFYNADDDTKISHDHVIVFRTSFNASTKNPYEYALPGWSIDFKTYFKDGKITYWPKDDRPTVSYCGYVDDTGDSFVASLKRMFKSKTDHESVAEAIRGKACRVLSRNKKIWSRFIIRNGFWAGGIADKSGARKEYANNIINSTYALVTRGGGNFSYRLYEVLSCGRIPLFIYTDSVLPFENDINWKKHMVWLDVKDCGKIDSILLDFNSKIQDDELKKLQMSNRKLYEEYLSPHGFFRHLHKKLLNKEL